MANISATYRHKQETRQPKDDAEMFPNSLDIEAKLSMPRAWHGQQATTCNGWNSPLRKEVEITITQSPEEDIISRKRTNARFLRLDGLREWCRWLHPRWIASVWSELSHWSDAQSNSILGALAICRWHQRRNRSMTVGSEPHSILVWSAAAIFVGILFSGALIQLQK